MDNNNTNNTDFIEGDPMPYSRLNILSVSNSIFTISNQVVLTVFFVPNPVNIYSKISVIRMVRLLILTSSSKLLVAFQQGTKGDSEFLEVADFAQRLRRMCKDHFYNKRRFPTMIEENKTESIAKLAHRRNMLNRHRRLLEEEFPAAGMDMLLSRKYMSDEELDDEHPPTGPILVLRSSYRSNNANRFLDRLDEMHVANIRIRRHQSNRVMHSIIPMEQAVPEELPR
ncbi:hypothetical protein BDC45DRAFT_582905 [Circinella umbellata]|nr:hypothetical protein BDC45DRAFT_582905 [Circinella umbellata]